MTDFNLKRIIITFYLSIGADECLTHDDYELKKQSHSHSDFKCESRTHFKPSPSAKL